MKNAYSGHSHCPANHNSRVLANHAGSRRIRIHGPLSGKARLLLAAALFVAFLAIGGPSAAAQFVGPTPLTLINGWSNAPYGTSLATVEQVAGIVQFKGAIATGGTDPAPFVLPAAFRPATDVYIKVDLCNATNGWLHIWPNGSVNVVAENGTFSNAQCFTSLDGASFAPSATGFTQLDLINGWTNAPFSTSNAAVELINGVVHFKGAIANGNYGNTSPFVLPAPFRPAMHVAIPVDLCLATHGELNIYTDGTVALVAEHDIDNAHCFTSLDGAWFVKNATGFQPLNLINGWGTAPLGLPKAMAGNAYGLVYFKGAISSGTNAYPFVLPPAFRPVTNVYIPVDLCNATNGRLKIQTDGTVTIEAENGTLFDAQCFTSLDGASFVQ